MFRRHIGSFAVYVYTDYEYHLPRERRNEH